MNQEFLLLAVNRMFPFEGFISHWWSKHRYKRMSVSSRGSIQITHRRKIKSLLLSFTEKHTQALWSLPGKHVCSQSLSLLVTPPWYLRNRKQMVSCMNSSGRNSSTVTIFSATSQNHGPHITGMDTKLQTHRKEEWKQKSLI